MLPESVMDVRVDWRVQWVRVWVEDALAGTKCTTEAVEDLWFSLRRGQRAALQTMTLVLDRARLAAQTPDVDGDWLDWWRSDCSDSSSDDGAADGGGAEGAGLVHPAQADGGCGGSIGGNTRRLSGSMERYTSVQHELCSQHCGQRLAGLEQLYRPWHGYFGSAELQLQHVSVLRELRTVSRFWERHPFGLPKLKAGSASMRRLGLEY